MDKEKSAVEKFLGGLEEENKPFEELPEEQIEIEVGKEDAPEEKAVPFHKDPKVQKYIDKQVAKALDNRKPTESNSRETPTENEEVTDVVKAFTAIIGNDTPEKVSALKALGKALSQADERASRKAIDEVNQIQQRQTQADIEAQQELDTALEDIEESYDVDITSNSQSAKKTRHEFVAFVERIAPKDRQGNIIDYPDMNSAWETFSEIKKSSVQPSRAKELASRGMARSAETTTAQPQKRATWDAADDFISSLK